MTTTVLPLLLQERRIAYAVVGRDLRVTEAHGAANLLLSDCRDSSGCHLTDLAPEMIGSEEAIADLLAGGLPRLRLAWVNRETADGQVVYVAMNLLPHRDEAGDIVGLLYLVQDVTETGQLEQRLTQQRNELRFLRDELKRQNLALATANAELKQVNAMKSIFVSVAAHELRTPLASISGYIEVLLDGDAGPLTERQADYLAVVQGSARRLLTITNDLLDLTRIEAGRIELVLRPTDLGAVIAGVAAEHMPQIQSKNQHLALDLPLALPRALCDGTRAAQVVGNLLANASKYTPEGGAITIGLAISAADGFLQVSVSDTGIGIAAADQSRLFERFFRGSGDAFAGVGGFGLGLHIARALTELSGGRIWFESQPQQGSTFHVTFPIAGEAPPAISSSV